MTLKELKLEIPMRLSKVPREPTKNVTWDKEISLTPDYNGDNQASPFFPLPFLSLSSGSGKPESGRRSENIEEVNQTLSHHQLLIWYQAQSGKKRGIKIVCQTDIWIDLGIFII